jgi:hypothetical protein
VIKPAEMLKSDPIMVICPPKIIDFTVEAAAIEPASENVPHVEFLFDPKWVIDPIV